MPRATTRYSISCLSQSHHPASGQPALTGATDRLFGQCLHGTRISVLVSVSSNTSYAKACLAFGTQPRPFVLDAGTSYHNANCKALSTYEKEHIRDATLPLKLRTATGVAIVATSVDVLVHYCICVEQLTVFAICGSACQVQCRVLLGRF